MLLARVRASTQITLFRRVPRVTQLSEAYATAKELGELVAVKRASATSLKREVAAAMDDEAAERLRARLAHDTGLCKGAVAQLKEIKPQIEALQQQLQLSQAVMQKDFDAWRQAALARAKADSVGGARGAACRDRTNAATCGGGARAHGFAID